MLRFYNTLTRKKENFKQLNDKNKVVTMYNCGPTVYDYAHIGNFRAFVASDILKRYLEYKGFKVKQVMNITDVDDKTIKNSKKKKISLNKFTEKYTKAFMEDLKELNISMPDIMPKATDHINEMVELIKILLEKKIAYKTKDGIYFSIDKFKNYGRLSNIDLSERKEGASERINKRVKSDEYDKDNPHDFALWKFWDKQDGKVFWDTEIGKGRPGWHIECSAMSMKYLGENFDIHTGGIDLVFPHHENEIAQSEAATCKKFVNFWMHNEYILVNGKKMSKSLGNFYTLRDLLKKGYSAKAIRYLLLSAHYRQQMNFTLEGLNGANNAVNRLFELIDNIELIKNDDKSNDKVKSEIANELTNTIKKAKSDFEDVMDNDLNTSAALGVLFEFIKYINKNMKQISKNDAKKVIKFIKYLDKILGLLKYREKVKDGIPKEIMNLVEEREKARQDKDYKKSDIIRNKIEKKGYLVADTSSGPVIKKK